MRVDETVLDDQDISVVIEFCRVATSARFFDDEREHFDEMADRFVRTRRRRIFRSGRSNPPTGIGFDFPMLLEQLLPIAAILWQATVDRVAEDTVDGLGRATANRVRKLMRRPGRDRELEPADQLTAEDEAKIFTLIVERAATLSIERQRAELLAEAVVGALRLDGGQP